MIKNVGTGPRVSQTVSDDSPLTGKNSATPQQNVTKTVNDTVMKPGNTSIAAESQISVLAMQSDLQNKLLEASKDQLLEKSNPRWKRPPSRNEAENWATLPVTLATGYGDDKVDIKMGTDGRVHVNVNGKEEWSGTLRQFRSLTIFTGDGNDVVKNSVDGARIATGLGNDVVWNQASNVTIDAGGGRDEVRSKGSGNEILTGSGDDLTVSVGDHNSISTGSGNDSVRFKGEFNQIHSGSGDDEVSSSGGNNTIRTEEGNDKVDAMYGDYLPTPPNVIDTGDGDDVVENEVPESTIRTGAGDDKIINSANGTLIETGDGEDNVNNGGLDVTVDGEPRSRYD